MTLAPKLAILFIIYPLRHPANAFNDDILNQLTCKMNDNKVPCIIALNLIQKRYTKQFLQCCRVEMKMTEDAFMYMYRQVHCAKNG